MLKILQILAMLSGIVINANKIEIMNVKENYQCFEIECLNSQNQTIKGSISIWMEKIMNPTVCQFPSNELYTYEGIANIYFLEYHDQEGNTLKTHSDRINNTFYNLCLETEKIGIKMLIKGCSYGYYMIPRLHHSVYATKLVLGKRLDNKFTKVNIFAPKDISDEIMTVKELYEYYNKWLESIKGIPY